MKQVIGYYKKVDVSREYGALIAYLDEEVSEKNDANYVVYLENNVVFVTKITDHKEILIAFASNFSFKTAYVYNF